MPYQLLTLILWQNVIKLKKNKNCISLFSSAGIGELGIKASDIKIVISNELIENRHALYQTNFPETKSFTGDIWEMKKSIVNHYEEKHSEEDLFLLYATPPCQGMSTNGAGKLISEVRKGNRLPDDQRNRLIIPTMEIFNKLKPEWIMLENVPNMQNTIIEDDKGNYVNIMDFIRKKIPKEYEGGFSVLNCADYGIPQSRKRLITIYTRNENGKKYFRNEGTFFPEYEKLPKAKHITLKDAIGNFPKLDAKPGKEKNLKFNPFHYVQVLNDEKYWWINNTPEGKSAFSNQCVNKDCMDKNNKTHGSNYEKGIHKSNDDTPIHCKTCGSLLPRPIMIDKKTKQLRLIKGFNTSYKRMEWNKPAPTLTQNFQFEASDNKIHPSQNRVLSLYEGLVLQTISNYDYKFIYNGQLISKTIMTEIIGESVPPKLIEMICKKIINIQSGNKRNVISKLEL